MSLLPWKEATVLSIEPMHPHLLQLVLRFPGESVDFRPGQFLTLDLPIHERPNKRWRSYSIASIPDGSDQCTLLIERCPDGPATAYLFEQLKVGQMVTCRGPQGTFCLPESIERPLLLVADGIGIVPFASILAQRSILQNNSLPIHLLFLTEKYLHNYFEPNLKQWEIKVPQFSYKVIEGNGVNEMALSCIDGFINNHADAQVYLCGWRKTVDVLRAQVLEKVISRKDVHIELFG
jgi:ferredoxin-NADP reductase